jgi:hypothetical protein
MLRTLLGFLGHHTGGVLRLVLAPAEDRIVLEALTQVAQLVVSPLVQLFPGRRPPAVLQLVAPT